MKFSHPFLIFAASSLAPLCAAAAISFQQSGLNLPASTAAFETRFDLDGDGRKDVVSIFQRRILIFFQRKNNTFPAAPDVEIGAGQPIPPIYAAVAIGKVSPADGLQLVLIGENGADYLTVGQLRGQSSEPVEPRVLLRRQFDISAGPDLFFLDCVMDINGDGEDEIVLPNSDQLEIYRPLSSGQELTGRIYLPTETVQRTSLTSEPPLLGSVSLNDSGAPTLVSTLPRLNRWYGLNFAVEEISDPMLVTDFNLDSRWDIVAPRRILYQDPKGEFKPVPAAIYDKIALATFLRSSNVAVAPNLVDFNRDGILDTFRVQTTAAKFSPRTDVAIFLGRQDRSLPDQPDFVLSTRDFAYNDMIPIGDVNGDGALDIGLFHFDFQPSSASSQLKAYIRSGLEGELRFYLWDKQRNRFQDKFSFKHRVLVNYGIYGMRQLFQQQVVMNRDVTGDDLPDLVMKTGAQEISIFPNLGGEKGFRASAAEVIRTVTPFSSLQVEDLNGDGLGDILISGYVEDQDERTIYSFFLSE